MGRGRAKTAHLGDQILDFDRHMHLQSTQKCRTLCFASTTRRTFIQNTMRNLALNTIEIYGPPDIRAHAFWRSSLHSSFLNSDTPPGLFGLDTCGIHAISKEIFLKNARARRNQWSWREKGAAAWCSSCCSCWSCLLDMLVVSASNECQYNNVESWKSC